MDKQKKADIIWSLRCSSARSLAYRHGGPDKARDLAIERLVQNRLLDEFNSLRAAASS